MMPESALESPPLPDLGLLIRYAAGFLIATALFVVNNSWETADTGFMPGIAALAAVKIFLTRALGLISLTFLALTVLWLSRRVLSRRYWCNIAEIEYAVRVVGWTAACCYAALALVSYLLLMTVLALVPAPVSFLMLYSCWPLAALCGALALLGIRYEWGLPMKGGLVVMAVAFFLCGLYLS